MARCPDCCKFVSPELGDAEVEDLEVDGDQVTANVHLTLLCPECGTELLETTLELEDEPEALAQHHASDKHGEDEEIEFIVEEVSCDSFEEAPKRKKDKTRYGATVGYRITCTCQKEPIFDGELKDSVTAGDMDEC